MPRWTSWWSTLPTEWGPMDVLSTGSPIERAANATQGFDTDDFTVCQFEPSNVHAGKPLAEFLNPVEPPVGDAFAGTGGQIPV